MSDILRNHSIYTAKAPHPQIRGGINQKFMSCHVHGINQRTNYCPGYMLVRSIEKRENFKKELNHV